jgi:hypothetical protein
MHKLYAFDFFGGNFREQMGASVAQLAFFSDELMRPLKGSV